MTTLLERYRPFFEPIDPPAADSQPGGGETGDAPPAGDPPAGDPLPADETTPEGDPAGDGPYRPEGLPDTMFGDDDQGTIDKMAAALKGYRDRDAQRTVPEDIADYSNFDLDNVPENVRGIMGELKDDPLFKTVAETARELKIGTADLQKLTSVLYSTGAEAGLFDEHVDVGKERGLLLPEDAKNLSQADQDKAIDARLQANADWLALMVKNATGEDGNPKANGLSAEAAKHAELMLMDTANGNQFLEWVRHVAQGGDRAQPNGGGNAANGQDRRAQLMEQLGRPEMQPDHPMFDRAKYDALEAEYRRVIGN